MGGTLWRGPSGTPAMELLLSEGDGAEEVEEVEVLKHRREGHAMNEERGVRRREANIVCVKAKVVEKSVAWPPRFFRPPNRLTRTTEQTGHQDGRQHGFSRPNNGRNDEF